MSYDYKAERPHLFTEDGVVMFTKIRDEAFRLCRLAGCVRADKLMNKAGGGSTWLMIACMDRLIELGELVEVTATNSVMGQHRIFRLYPDDSLAA